MLKTAKFKKPAKDNYVEAQVVNPKRDCFGSVVQNKKITQIFLQDLALDTIGAIYHF